MDVRALFKLLRQEYGLSNNECVLYYEIRCIYFYGGKNACYASNEYFESELGISSGTVKRGLNILKQKGLIQTRTEKVERCILARNIYPLEDEILLKEAEKIKHQRLEQFNRKEDQKDPQEDHVEDQNEPLQEDHFVPNQEDQNDPAILDIYNFRSLNLKKDIPEDHNTYVNSRIEGATAPVKTSFDVSISKPMFEKDPKERWNEIASRYHLSKVHRFDKDRIASLKARIKDCDSEDVFWNTIEAALEKSKFLQGKSSNWKPNVDFFLRRSSFVKVAEGAYTTQKASLIESDNSSPIEQAVNGYKPQSQAELIEAFLNS